MFCGCVYVCVSRIMIDLHAEHRFEHYNSSPPPTNYNQLVQCGLSIVEKIAAKKRYKNLVNETVFKGNL